MSEIAPENAKELLKIQDLSMDDFLNNMQKTLNNSDKKGDIIIEKIDEKKLKLINKNGVENNLVIDFKTGYARLAYGGFDTFSLYIKNKNIGFTSKKPLDIYKNIVTYISKLQEAIYKEYEEGNGKKSAYMEIPGYNDYDEVSYIINLSVTLEAKKQQEKLDQNINNPLIKKD